MTNTDHRNEKKYDFISIGLKPNREELYNKINCKVEEMFDHGSLEEANKLKSYKHFNEIIGYRELTNYFNGDITLSEAKELIKKNTRHYAKRQMTWFNNQMTDVNWFSVNYYNFDETIEEITKFLDKLKIS